MKMIGLRDVAMTAQELDGRTVSLSFRVGEEVDVPEAWAKTVASVGYAKVLEAENVGT